MTSSRVDIGAVILLDPAPAHAMVTKSDRLQILDRYIQALISLQQKVRIKLRRDYFKSYDEEFEFLMNSKQCLDPKERRFLDRLARKG